jgi:uncharacterized protein (DUF4415 family)
MSKTTISQIGDSWDDESFGEEDGALKVASKEVAGRLDEAAGTQLVSIRMSKSMIDAFKAISAANNGIGYQTLMKQILQRFIDSEMKRIWRAHLEELEAAAKDKQQEKGRTKERQKKVA